MNQLNEQELDTWNENEHPQPFRWAFQKLDLEMKKRYYDSYINWHLKNIINID